MSQLVLPGLSPRFPDGGDGSGPGGSAPPAAEAADPAADPAEGQLALFADRVSLERDLDFALRTGAVREARRLRDAYAATYGRSEAVSWLGLLDALEAALVAGDVRTALDAWEAAAGAVSKHAAWRRSVGQGCLRGLIDRFGAGVLVACRPACLTAVVNALSSAAVEAGLPSSAEARRLVRDALLAGHAPDAAEIEGDEALADLLAEDRSPPWLACLGAIRRLWPVPPASPDGLRALTPGHAREDPRPDALRFWDCLRVAENPDRPEPLLHAARRGMKALDPELHGLYMRRLRPLV